jgi:hypothetical protein
MYLHNAKELSAKLKSIGFIEIGNLIFGKLISEKFGIKVYFDEDNDLGYFVLKVTYFKDSKGFDSTQFIDIEDKKLDIIDKEGCINILGLFKSIYESMDSVFDGVQEIKSHLNSGIIEMESSGKEFYTVSLQQTYVKVFDVYADSSEEAIDYVDGCIAVFSENNYLYGSSIAEIME